MTNDQWEEYKRLVAEGMEPSEAHGRVMPALRSGIDDCGWLHWLEHCRERADVQAQEDPDRDPDPFNWEPEGKLTASQEREKRRQAAYDRGECVRLAALPRERMATLPDRVAAERARLRAERGLSEEHWQ